MKVLVTGGAGFIGSHITDQLINGGYKVVVVDKELTNTNPNAKYYQQDITHYDEMQKIFKKEQPELVTHQAAHVSVPGSVKDPVYDAQNNVIGTINMLKLSKENNVKNFVFASSCSIYGDPDTKYATEESPVKPESPYAASKASCENYIRIFMENHAILRYSNVYGPRQATGSEGLLIPIFATKMKKNERVTIYGDGNQVRDFVYVEDVARTNIKALQGRGARTLNVGTKKGTTVNQVYEHLKELTGYKLEPEYVQKREGDVYRVTLDNARMERELNYLPQTTLKQGLELTVPTF